MSNLTKFAIATSLLLTLTACGSSDQNDPELAALNETVANLGSKYTDQSETNAPDTNSTSPQEHRIPIKVRNLAGEPEQDAYLVDRLANTTSEKVEDAVREAGFACSSVRGFYQLGQKDELMDVYKIDCGEGSYQLTAINGDTFFKPWTGNMMGSTQ